MSKLSWKERIQPGWIQLLTCSQAFFLKKKRDNIHVEELFNIIMFFFIIFAFTWSCLCHCCTWLIIKGGLTLQVISQYTYHVRLTTLKIHYIFQCDFCKTSQLSTKGHKYFIFISMCLLRKTLKKVLLADMNW